MKIENINIGDTLSLRRTGYSAIESRQIVVASIDPDEFIVCDKDRTKYLLGHEWTVLEIKAKE